MLQPLSEVVGRMNEHTILDWQPQAVVADIVENFWMKKYSERQLLNTTVETLEEASKYIYRKSRPLAKEDLLNDFASDVVFHLAYRLSNQGRLA